MDHCIRHYEEPYEANCRECHRPFCSRCLVYSFGPKKPPFCVGCALHASGVRNGGTQVISAPPPKVDRSVARAEKKAAKAHARAEAKAAKEAAKQGGYPAPSHLPTTTVPAPANLSTPASRFAPSHSEQAVS